jgi:hypothetical protein
LPPPLFSIIYLIYKNEVKLAVKAGQRNNRRDEVLVAEAQNEGHV